MDDESTEELTVECRDCGDLHTPDSTVDDENVCESCMDSYSPCDDCDTLVLADDRVLVYKMDTYRWRTMDRNVCDDCADNYHECDSCNERHDILNETLDDESVCEGCRENMNYCEECDGYYSDYSSDDHSHTGCDCEPPSGLKFRIKNGDDWLNNDTRVEMTLPSGVISEVGMDLIRGLMRQEGHKIINSIDPTLTRYSEEWRKAREVADAEQSKWYELAWAIDESVGTEWQTSRGNFTKRLSRFAHLSGLKITADVLTSVGNIAREQSTGSTVHLEVTRDLNLPAADFYHEDSCWWQSYSDSRCALKTNGGIGMRTFGGSGSSWQDNSVTGRAWAMPLKWTEKIIPLGSVWTDGAPVIEHAGTINEWITYPDAGRKQLEGPAQLKRTLAPTFDTESPDAWMIFNGYGDLAGYAAARILGAMTGLTYRKVDFEASPMYVNAGGFIVGTEDTAREAHGNPVNLSLDTHGTIYENERRAEMIAA